MNLLNLLLSLFRREEIPGVWGDVRILRWKPGTGTPGEPFDFLGLLERPGFEPFARHWQRIAPKRDQGWDLSEPIGIERAEVFRLAWYWYLRGENLVPLLNQDSERGARFRRAYEEVCRLSGMSRDEYERLAWYPLDKTRDSAAAQIFAWELAFLEGEHRQGYGILEFLPFTKSL